MISFLCFVYSVVENHLKKENKHQVKILVYIVTYIHIVNKFCHDIRHKKNLYRPALVKILIVYFTLSFFLLPVAKKKIYKVKKPQSSHRPALGNTNTKRNDIYNPKQPIASCKKSVALKKTMVKKDVKSKGACIPRNTE